MPKRKGTVDDERRVWVGFADGKPHRSRDDRYEAAWRLSVFSSRAEARKCFEDVRSATLVIPSQVRPEVKG